MSMETLQALYELEKRLAEEKEILAGLQAAAYPGAQNLDGLPHGTGVSDKVAKLAIEIVEIKNRIEQTVIEIEPLEKVVSDFLGTINDSYIVMVVRLRFICAMSWKDVAVCMGGGNSEESVKMNCYRFLSKICSP